MLFVDTVCSVFFLNITWTLKAECSICIFCSLCLWPLCFWVKSSTTKTGVIPTFPLCFSWEVWLHSTQRRTVCYNTETTHSDIMGSKRDNKDCRELKSKLKMLQMRFPLYSITWKMAMFMQWSVCGKIKTSHLVGLRPAETAALSKWFSLSKWDGLKLYHSNPFSWVH